MRVLADVLLDLTYLAGIALVGWGTMRFSFAAGLIVLGVLVAATAAAAARRL